MSGFTLIKYQGEDAGDVLVTLILDGAREDTETEVVELSTRAPMGFMPNPPEEEEEEEDEDEDEEV